jgi:Icc-related predicted phosphoesterase
VWSKIPDDVDILITHTPPYGILDISRSGTNAGCEVLRDRLQRLPSCRLHVFGHIHEAHGALIDDIGHGEQVFVNAALGSRSSGRGAVIVDLLK